MPTIIGTPFRNLLLEGERREVGILGGGIEAGAVFLDPWQVAMTQDAGVGVVVLQSAEQFHHRTFLGGRTGVIMLAVGINATLVANAYRVGVVAAGMGARHVLGATLVQLSVFRHVVVVADVGIAPA